MPQVLPVEQAAALALKDDPAEALLFTAKVDIFFLILSLSQSGHFILTVEKPKTSASKGFPQSSQTNS